MYKSWPKIPAFFLCKWFCCGDFKGKEGNKDPVWNNPSLSPLSNEGRILRKIMELLRLEKPSEIGVRSFSQYCQGHQVTMSPGATSSYRDGSSTTPVPGVDNPFHARCPLKPLGQQTPTLHLLNNLTGSSSPRTPSLADLGGKTHEGPKLSPAQRAIPDL